MKPNIEEWTIVLVGNWNVAILNPDWVAREIFGQKEVFVEMIFGEGQIGFRMGAGSVQITPAQNRVVIASLSTTEVDKSEKVACRLLDILPVTPLTAIGVNFGFLEKDPSPEILSLFDLKDNSRISREDWTITDTSIVRTLKLNENTLNLRLAHGTAGVSLHANYHWNVGDASEAKAAIEGKVVSLRDQARATFKRIYDLEDEENLT